MKTFFFFLSISVFLFFSCSPNPEEKKIAIDSPVRKADPAGIIPDCFLEDLFKIKTEAQLISRYGAEHISLDTIRGEEGGYVVGSFIDAHTKNEVEIRWNDASRNTGVKDVIIRWDGEPPGEWMENRWKSKTGIKIGVTTDYLEKLNGKSFIINPFDESVVTEISSWNGGNLNGKEVGITLSASGKMNGLSQKEMKEIFNQYNIPSTNPVIRKIQPSVIVLTLHNTE